MVDARSKAMNQDHSTNFRQAGANRAPKGKRGKPHCVVRHHSVTVPIYAHSLCHPFPVTRLSTTRLTGHARAVLFHNGTWLDWRHALRWVPVNQLT